MLSVRGSHSLTVNIIAKIMNVFIFPQDNASELLTEIDASFVHFDIVSFFFFTKEFFLINNILPAVDLML